MGRQHLTSYQRHKSLNNPLEIEMPQTERHQIETEMLSFLSKINELKSPKNEADKRLEILAFTRHNK